MKYCENCEHEMCGACTQCHNMDCEWFGKPFMGCFDVLLPKKPYDPTLKEQFFKDYGIPNGDFDKGLSDDIAKWWITIIEEIVDKIELDELQKVVEVYSGKPEFLSGYNSANRDLQISKKEIMSKYGLNPLPRD